MPTMILHEKNLVYLHFPTIFARFHYKMEDPSGG